MAAEHNWPTGAVTFLFTDLEDSTPLWDRHRSAMGPALAEHDALLKTAVEANAGVLVKTTGDGLMAAFDSPFSALSAALEAQRDIEEASWSTIVPDRIRVRMGLHTGEAELRAGDYYGTVVNRAARLMSIGHGSQILVSGTTARLIKDNLPDDIGLVDLGEHRLKGLARPAQVYQVLAPFLPSDFALLRSEAVVKNHLPQPLTTFVGRELELKQLDEFFANPDTRLVTVLGPGGMGKTRLSIEWARRKASAIDQAAYTHGFHFIDLAPLETSEQIVPAMAEVFAFPLQAGLLSPEQQMLDFLREKHMLLIFDNFEQTVGAAAFALQILRAAPAVRFLVTSRERLNLTAEQVYAIEGLAYPPDPLPDGADLEKYAAVQLFIRSAQRVRPGFDLAGNDREAVVRICRTSAGMPLAIELAAAWLDLMPAVEIADEIEQRLDVLETGLLDMPERHRSIRAAIDTTWNYLQPEQQQIFARLSIFRGGFTWEAATAVLEDEGGEMALRSDLSKLRDKSLLGYDAGADRLTVHELLRQYGAEKMSASDRPTELPAVKERHALYYVQLLANCTPGLKGSEFENSLRLIESDLDNILAAWDWLVIHGHRRKLAAAIDGLGLFHEIRGYITTARKKFSFLADRWRERLVIRALGSNEAAPDRLLLAKTLAWQSIFERSREKAEELLQEAITILKDPRLQNKQDNAARAFAYLRLGVTFNDSNKALAVTYLNHGLEIYRELDDLWGIGFCLYYLGLTTMYINLLSGHRYILQASEVFEKSGDVRGLGQTLSYLVVVAALQGDEETLDKAFSRYMDLVAGLGQQVLIAETLDVQELHSIGKGRYGQAAGYLEKQIHYLTDLGRSVTHGQINLALQYLHVGQIAKARTLLQRTRREIDQAAVESDWRRAWNLHVSAMLALTEGELEKAYRELQEALIIYKINEDLQNQAGAEVLAAMALIGMGELETPRPGLINGLNLSLEQGAFIPLLEAMLGIALLLAFDNQPVRAREVYETFRRHPRFSNSALYEGIAGRKIRSLTSTLTPEHLQAIEDRASENDIWREAAALLAELQAAGAENSA